MTPSIELQQWISLIKDACLAVTTIVTVCLGIYGVRTWKRELAGKEIYVATKNLVKETHNLVRFMNTVRTPIQNYEHRVFTKNDYLNLTENEMWRMSEADAMRHRLNEFEVQINRYEVAKLEARILLGSRVNKAFLPFGKLITEVVIRIGNYVSALDDLNHPAHPNDVKIKALQIELYSSDNLDDDLSQKISDAREQGEKVLLPFLHRSRIDS